MMWKWLAVAALLYGLLAMGALFRPRQPVSPDEVASLADLNQALSEMAPRHQPLIDFESQGPPPVTRPPAHADVKADNSGNHYLEWEYDTADGAMHSLGLPLAAEGNPGFLSVEIKGTYSGTIIVGLREHDGSVYVASRELVRDERQLLEIPLAELQLSERTEDENSSLDLDAIAVLFTDPHLTRKARKRGRTRIQLDNIHLK